MKLCTRILAIVVIVSVCAFATSCAGPSAGVTYQNVGLTLTPFLICNSCFTGSFYYQINPAGAGGVAGAIEMPAGGGTGGCIELQATVTNAPQNLTWTIIPTANGTVPAAGTGTGYPPAEPGPNVGTLSSTTGSMVYYCEPGGIPNFTGSALAQAQAAGLPPGFTEVMVSTPNPSNPSQPITATQVFAFQLQTPPTGMLATLTPNTSVIVPLGTTYQFQGYVAGANGFDPCHNNPGVPAYGVVYQVNTVDGGAGTGAGQFGTISSTGLYTAPTAYPSATVHTANVTVRSQACPTIISAVTTVTFP